MGEPALDPRVRTLSNGDEAWTVKERNAANDAGAKGRRCLVFMSDTVIRRVWGYPERWFDLTDAALLALADAMPTRASEVSPPVQAGAEGGSGATSSG